MATLWALSRLLSPTTLGPSYIQQLLVQLSLIRGVLADDLSASLLPRSLIGDIEVANNLILDGHTLGAIQAVITDNAWAKLTENQQAAIMEAGADTQAFNADLSESAENKVLDELKSSGCNVVDVPDKAPWQEACAKVISENTFGSG